MKRANLIAGFVVLGIACLCIGAMLHGNGPNVRSVPLWEALFLAVVALCLIASNLRGHSIEKVKWPTGDGKRMVLHLIATLVGYLLLAEVIGYISSTFLFMVAASIAWRRYSWRFLVISAAIYCLILFLVFDVFLKMTLPQGLIGLP